MTIYRAESKPADPDRVFFRREPLRLPGNVPYLVDNIWEWLRPDGFPSRRAAVFASPTAALAIQSVSPDAVAHRVVFGGPTMLAQIAGIDDARDHPDVRALRTLIQDRLRAAHWMDAPLSDRRIEAPLFMPWAGKADLDSVFADSPVLSGIADTVRATGTLWRDITLLRSDEPVHERGEIFFEPGADGFRLIAV